MNLVENTISKLSELHSVERRHHQSTAGHGFPLSREFRPLSATLIQYGLGTSNLFAKVVNLLRRDGFITMFSLISHIISKFEPTASAQEAVDQNRQPSTAKRCKLLKFEKQHQVKSQAEFRKRNMRIIIIEAAWQLVANNYYIIN